MPPNLSEEQSADPLPIDTTPHCLLINYYLLHLGQKCGCLAHFAVKKLDTVFLDSGHRQFWHFRIINI
jgi:hypothetical protein